MQPPNVLYINKIGGKRLFTAEKGQSNASGRHKYFSSSYFGSIVSCLLYTTLNEIIIFD